MRRLSRGRWLAAYTVLFLAVGFGAYALAASPFVGPHGNINACVPPGGGEVNVWKPGHRCSGGRVNLAFPTTGTTGATGATGQTGATGATGLAGAPNPSATTVDGESVTKLSLRVPTPASGASTLTLYSTGGLTILASCDSAGDASLQANGPASTDAELTVSGFTGGTTGESGATGTTGATSATGATGTSGAYGSQTATLGPQSAATLGPTGSGQASFSYSSSAGTVVSGDVGYQKAPSFAGYPGCAFFGTVSSG
jgi:hypothetical protein